jgi:hypothetical protein
MQCSVCGTQLQSAAHACPACGAAPLRGVSAAPLLEDGDAGDPDRTILIPAGWRPPASQGGLPVIDHPLEQPADASDVLAAEPLLAELFAVPTPGRVESALAAVDAKAPPPAQLADFPTARPPPPMPWIIAALAGALLLGGGVWWLVSPRAPQSAASSKLPPLANTPPAASIPMPSAPAVPPASEIAAIRAAPAVSAPAPALSMPAPAAETERAATAQRSEPAPAATAQRSEPAPAATRTDPERRVPRLKAPASRGTLNAAAASREGDAGRADRTGSDAPPVTEPAAAVKPAKTLDDLLK